MSLRSEVIRILNEVLGNSKKITELPAATLPLDGTEWAEVVQDGISKKAQVTEIGSGGGGGGTWGSITGTLSDQTDLNTALGLKEATANKDATGGYAGLTLFKINFKNVLNTFTSFFTNSNTAARTYTFQDRNGTIADDTDLALKVAKAGDTMSGNLAMGTNKVTGLGAATANGDALRYEDVIGVQDLYIPASAMWPRNTNPCAELSKTELATSLLNIQTLDFDQTTQECAQFTIVLPRKYNNGTITAVFYWTASAGSGDVQWGIIGGAYSNDDALTVVMGSAQTADDTLIATNDLHISPATSAITLAGTPADADFLAFQITRNPASDTLNADAKLLGVSLRITVDAGKDA